MTQTKLERRDNKGRYISKPSRKLIISNYDWEAKPQSLQLSLSGEGEDNSEIDRQIKEHRQWEEEMEWILSDKCEWDTYEKTEWFRWNDGGWEEEELWSESIESLLEGRIRDLRHLIQELENEKVSGKW